MNESDNNKSDNNKQGAPWREPEAAPFIRIEKVSKQFGHFTAVDSVDLDIYQGELFTILGASGSGKTTLLRMLAGFETPSSGRIIIDGIDMTLVPPYERPVNMMFQSYAVFPHMTVEKNVAYGLKKEGVARAEIAEQVEEMLSLVQLSGFGRRKPRELSGGQLQRVALARALIKRPKVLLLDEPLAALDKKLREETQFELMNIQDELGITFIVVTHDQEEAMTLSTRIAVMNEGRFVQTGTPTEVYEFPNNRFVAGFFGTINMFEGEVVSIDANAILIETADCGVIKALPSAGMAARDRVLVAVRPEKISISKEPVESDGVTCVKGTIWDLGYYGNYSIYRVKTGSDTYIQVSAQNQFRASEHILDWEDEVYVSWDLNSNIVLQA